VRLRRFTFSRSGSQPKPNEIVPLDKGQSHQGIFVLRLTVGQKIELTSPWGLAGAVVEKIYLKPQPTLWVRIMAPFEAPKIVSGPILALALIKGPRFDWAVEKATELGATSLVPLITTRSNPLATGTDKKARWLRLSEEARKQCGRPRPMAIDDPIPIETWISGHLPDEKYLLDFGGSLLEGVVKDEVCLLVGPEGGLTDEEKKMALKVGFKIYSLGNLTLRSETAAITALARLISL
jgi:16S rRNA (uracil1498-N3)-methyltransferase